MGISGLLWRRLSRPLIMSQTEARAFSARKNKAPRDTLRHIKNKEKNRNEALGPHTFYIQTVASGSRDTGASLYVFSEHNRYLFNCGEGTQRLMQENKLKLSHLNTLFVTRMSWANVGGLSGMLLTLRDVGLPSCVVAGPPQMEKFLQAIKTYCGPLEGLKVEVHPYTNPVYSDTAMTVHQVPIFSDGNELVSQPLDLSPSAEPGGRSDGRTYTEPRRRTVDRGPPCVISFVCKVNDRKGHFLVVKAKEIGLPVGTSEIGPLVLKLKAGQSVTYQGKEIFPADVLSPDNPGPTFLVVECPSEDFITPLTENETLKRYQEGEEGGGVALIVHMTPQHILHHSAYRKWMERFGPGAEHLILNESVSSIHNQSAYRVQTQLNLIHPGIFPPLPDLSRKEEEAAEDVRGVKAECLLKYQLRPTREWQRDMVTSNNTPEFVEEAMTLPGFPDALKECKLLLEADLPQPAEMDPQYPVVVFLGTGSAVPMKTRNVSSTLLHVSPSQVLLLDCGEGTFAQLYRHYGDEVDDVLCQLSAVFVSHIHADHHTGLLSVLYERERALRSRGKPFSPVILIGPTLVMTWLNQFHDHCQAFLHNISFIPSRSLVEGVEVDCPKTKSLISSLLEKYQLDKFQTCYVRHCKNAFGCSVVHQSGWKLVFSGDTMPCEALIEMGKNATLLIHEATLEDGLEEDAKEKAHSTTSQAIGVGRKMNADYMMLNHFSQRYSKLPLMSDEFSRKVGISFDHMRIRWSDFKILPKLMGPLKVLFAEDLLEMEEKKEKRERIQQEVQKLADAVGAASSKRELEVDKEASAKRIKAQ